MFLFTWFAEGSARYYSFVVMTSAIVWSFVVGMITRNYSQVDKMWSFLPPIYCTIVALNTTTFEPRILLMTALTWLWGLRLSYNFARKGGYTWAGEDYRWPIIKKIVTNRVVFELFNLTFISILQNLLLLFIASPIFFVAQHRSTPLNGWDLVCTLLFLFFFAIEVTADEQQWKFHQEKKAGNPKTKDGFLRTGLFRYSRHPNFFSEICIWWIFYAFTFAIRPFALINWTIWGAVSLTLLIHFSTGLTESISSEKYAKYKQYQQTTSRLIPWLPGKKLE